MGQAGDDWGGGAPRGGAACLVATHDADALGLADRILSLEDGRLREVAA